MSNSGRGGEPITPTRLAVNGRSSPNNLRNDVPPRFSWRVDDWDWGSDQTAYRVRVARSCDRLDDAEPYWDSGKVSSPKSTDVEYGGPNLAPDTRYCWTVEVWNDTGDRSGIADPVPFTTAPEQPMAGDWIAHSPGPGDTNGYRSEWSEPGSADKWVQVDLEGRRDVARVELYPAQPFDGPTTPDGQAISASDTEDSYFTATLASGPVAFGFPDRYRIEASDDPDFETSTVIVDRTDESQDSPGRDPVGFDVDASTRYVRVVATEPQTVGGGDDRLEERLRQWQVFALAEVGIRDRTGDDLASGRPVTASSSVESGTWGADHLTNGVCESSMASSSPLLRRDVELDGTVERAHVHFAGLGYGELYVNGTRVGDEMLNPGWSDYAERVLYATHEVGEFLSEGTNCIGAWLGRGWFSKSARQWTGFGSPRALLRLSVEFEDGRTRVITTDDDWRTTESPIVANDIYDGDTYDARREQPGWTEPGFDDGDWERSTVVEGPLGELYPQQTSPIRVTETLSPEEIREYGDEYIVDFGQNHTGWLEISVDDAEAGQQIDIHYAETLAAHGDLLTVDLRTADTVDTYVTGGKDRETYEPRFTYHGYRYTKISGFPGTLTSDDIASKVVHTDLDSAGSFECSNEELNRVNRKSRWRLRTNAHGVPTDCPQRDERQGFTGDAHLAAGALLYNFDGQVFYEKFLRDHADVQSEHGYLPATMPNGGTPAMTDVTWTYSWLQLPRLLHRHRGTKQALRDHYDGLRRYIDFWHSVAEDGLVPGRYSIFGDWVALENADGSRGQPTELFTDAYYYRTAADMAEIAASLGEDANADMYRDRAEEIASAFDDRYFDETDASYGPGTQAANAVPLSLGLVPERHEDAVAATLAETVRDDGGTLRTGFLGTPALLSALTEHGHADLAYRVVTAPEYLSWVYQVRQGATAVWERWDTDEQTDSGMNSRNHSPFTLVSEWLHRAIAGIRVTSALSEQRRIVVHPEPVADLDWAEGAVETPNGEVRSRWERAAGGIDMSVDVPWGLTASVRVPLETGDTVTWDGEVVWAGGEFAGDSRTESSVSDQGDRIVVDVRVGHHDFRVE